MSKDWREIAKDHLVNLARWDKNKKVMVDNHFIKIDGLRQVSKALKPIRNLKQEPREIQDGWISKTSIEFEDGSYFEAWASATDSNIKEKMKAYKLEMSCTRSEARVLRVALGIDMCSYEELGQQSSDEVSETQTVSLEPSIPEEPREPKEPEKPKKVKNPKQYLMKLNIEYNDVVSQCLRHYKKSAIKYLNLNEVNSVIKKVEKEAAKRVS